MSSPYIPTSYPANDSSILATFLPNRGRTRFVRAAILLSVAAGILGWIAIAGRIYSEVHARHSWPVVPGHVTDVQVKSYTGPSSKDHVSHYYVEYRVQFAVPAEQCLTGMSFVLEGKLPLCEGIARTRTTDSQALANSWFERHRSDTSVGVLHDPNGPGVKIVGEPANLVYPWKEIYLMSGWMLFFGALLVITQRRLQYLKTLPVEYDSSPQSRSQARADDLTDINL